MSWHKNTLLKYKKEITQSAVLSFVLALVFAVYLWHLGNTFVWEPVTPIEQPNIFDRPFYSALVYLGPGALIYGSGFYKILYAPFRGTRGGYREYKKMKRDFWDLLMLVMYLYVIPFMIDVLNTIASFFYNTFKFILYLSPALGLFIFLSIFISYIYSRAKWEPIVLDLDSK